MHEDDFSILQDVLVLMKAKTTIMWMKKELLTLMLADFNGMQDGTYYARRPVGNSPGFVPLYHSINKYILCRTLISRALLG